MKNKHLITGLSARLDSTIDYINRVETRLTEQHRERGFNINRRLIIEYLLVVVLSGTAALTVRELIK